MASIHTRRWNLESMKNIIVFSLLAIVLSCSKKECSDVEQCKGNGNKMRISLIECGDSSKVFDLDLKMDLVEDSLDNQNFVKVNSNNISLNRIRKFDYEVVVMGLDDNSISIAITLSEGDRLNVLGTEITDKRKVGFDSKSKTIKGALVSFLLNAEIDENPDGTYFSRVSPDLLCKNALVMFNKNYAEMGKEYKLALSINQ